MGVQEIDYWHECGGGIKVDSCWIMVRRKGESRGRQVESGRRLPFCELRLVLRFFFMVCSVLFDFVFGGSAHGCPEVERVVHEVHGGRGVDARDPHHAPPAQVVPRPVVHDVHGVPVPGLPPEELGAVEAHQPHAHHHGVRDRPLELILWGGGGGPEGVRQSSSVLIGE